jgi:hypothetical protein
MILNPENDPSSSIPPQEGEAVNESSDEVEGGPFPPLADDDESNGPFPTLGTLAAICLLIFALFFLMKQGPEEPPPGQAEILAPREQAGQGVSDAQEVVIPVPVAGEPDSAKESTGTPEAGSAWRKALGEGQ